MTREEAKANLEKLLLLYDDGMIDFSAIRESVKVAIEALRNSPTQMSGTSDLIRRDDAIKALSHMMDVDGFRDGWAVSRSNVDCMLKAMPSADVPEIIRCKDCKNSYKYHDLLYCDLLRTKWNKDYSMYVDADDFCSYGERKKDG